MTDKIRLDLPENAPKDGSMFLADFGWGRLMPTAWCKIEQTWITFRLKRTDKTYFENQEESIDFLRGWMPIPKDWLYTSRYKINEQ